MDARGKKNSVSNALKERKRKKIKNSYFDD